MSSITPSRQCGISEEKELLFRQLAANFIEYLGKDLTSYLAINTAIVYMHRFYMHHSFTMFPWETTTTAALFLAAKVEGHPCKLNLLIAKLNDSLHGKQPEDSTSVIDECLLMENLLLPTLGFDLNILQPHTIIIRCYENKKIPKHVSKAAYYLSTYVLQLTVMCIHYNPTTIACFCLHLASKWSEYVIPKTTEDQEWYYDLDNSITVSLLENLTMDFEEKINKCPAKLKESITTIYNNCCIEAKKTSNYINNQKTSQQFGQSLTEEFQETPITLKRTHSLENVTGQLQGDDESNETKVDTSPTDESIEPVAKVNRTVHLRDPRTKRPDLTRPSSSKGFQMVFFDAKKIEHPRDPRTISPKKQSLKFLDMHACLIDVPNETLSDDTYIENLNDLPNEISGAVPQMQLSDRPTEEP